MWWIVRVKSWDYDPVVQRKYTYIDLVVEAVSRAEAEAICVDEIQEIVEDIGWNKADAMPIKEFLNKIW